MNTSQFFAPPADDCDHEEAQLVSQVQAPSGIYFTTDQPEFCINRSTIVRMLGTADGVTITPKLECETCGDLADVEFDIDGDGGQIVTRVAS